MELWQMDVMGGELLDDGRELKAVTAIDDHSRYGLAVGLVARATTRPVCEVFAGLLQRFGVPQEILTDGKVFTGRYAEARRVRRFPASHSPMLTPGSPGSRPSPSRRRTSSTAGSPVSWPTSWPSCSGCTPGCWRTVTR
jgi:hypothetical protein